jgi:hypothetical protein
MWNIDYLAVRCGGRVIPILIKIIDLSVYQEVAIGLSGYQKNIFVRFFHAVWLAPLVSSFTDSLHPDFLIT